MSTYRKMKSYSKLQRLASLLCAVSLMISLCIPSVHAVTAHAVTATTVSTVKQGNTAYCYVSIDATESLAALDVGVHFDPAKVKITGAYNSVGCTLYDSAIHDDHVQFSYVLDGKARHPRRSCSILLIRCWPMRNWATLILTSP